MLLRSEQIGDLMKALAAAQGEFPLIKKDTKNYYGGKYAQLDAIVDAVRPSLSKNGIAFYHICESDLEARTASVTTYLQFGEQWIANFLSASAVSFAWDKDAREKIERFDTQTISIVHTYFKRTTLQSVTGVAAEEDSDSQELVGNNPPAPKKTPPANQAATPKSTPAQAQLPAQTQAAPPAGQGIFKLLPAGELICRIKSLTKKETVLTPEQKAKGNKPRPYLVVTVNGMLRPEKDEHKASVNHGFCYDTGLFDALTAGLDKECKLQVDTKGKYVTVTDVLYIDGVEYKDGVVFVADEEEPTPEP
jgi:ERF superfamily